MPVFFFFFNISRDLVADDTFYYYSHSLFYIDKKMKPFSFQKSYLEDFSSKEGSVAAKIHPLMLGLPSPI